MKDFVVISIDPNILVIFT